MIPEPGDVGYWEYQREQFAKNANNPSPELTARMVALVKLMASKPVHEGLIDYAEARALAAELEPVDADEAEAVDLTEKAIDLHDYARKHPKANHWAVKLTLAAIKRGRALERGEAK